MAKVLVLGATGIIGLAVATAYRRAGYVVYGLARTEDKAKILSQNEIIPVLGKAQETSSWESVANQADIIVEAIADYQDYSTPAVVQKVLLPLAQQKVVVYTSGVWVYGSPSSTVTESSPVNPPQMVSWRPAFEKAYLEAGAVVIRPGCVYGKGGSLLGMLFGQLTSGKGVFPGTGQQTWCMVHTDDLAQLYLLAGEKPSVSKGQVFNGITNVDNYGEVVKAAAAVVGYTGEIKWNAPSNPFEECLALSCRASGLKAKNQLGWEPKHNSFLDNVELYHRSWKASQ